MIRVVMFDLGLTLLDANEQPLAHVREALAAIAAFETADGKPLRSCLVSDVAMPTPLTPATVRAAFDEYLAVLDRSGLRASFEPVQRRVTLSVHAGELKPARVVFETALRRLRVKASLDECLFVTENAAHSTVARDHWHMAVLRFHAAGGGTFDFDDWSQAPALIAQRVASARDANVHAAIRTHLAARGVEVGAIAAASADGARAVSGRVWRTVAGEPGEPPLQVSVPVAASVSTGPRGELRSHIGKPTTEEVDEAANYARSLAANRQIAPPGEAVTGEATHAVEVDAQGRRKLVRRRFKAF